MTLHEFVALPHRFSWGGAGGDDCLTVLGRRTEDRFGFDPIAHLRGTYSDEDGARRILAQAGGPVPLVGKIAAIAGFERVDGGFKDDDIAVVRARSVSGFSDMGAIRFGPLWLVMSHLGLIGKVAEPIAVWRREQ